MKNICAILSRWGAGLITILVLYAVYQGYLFNPLAYLLYAMLSFIAAWVYLRAERGGHQIMFVYGFGDGMIGLYSAYKSKAMSFGTSEATVLVLIVVSIAVYLWCELQGQKRGLKEFMPAVAMNGVSICLVNVFFFLDIVKHPEGANLFVFFLYIIISSLAWYGEESFNAKLVPRISIMSWIIIINGVLISGALRW
jgi:hypothetical protein